MIMMRIFLPLTTSRLQVARVVAVVGLATVGIASCGVDSSGLNSMPFLPHDASSADTAGAAGATGSAGSAGSSAGTAGGGGSATGIAGGGGTTAGAGGAGPGDAGTSGAAGSAGSGGNAGTAGSAGIGGIGGTAGTGVAGIGGRGGAGGTVGGRGGTGGVVVPCTPATCSDGCCKDSTTCVRMRSAMQCGAMGAACAPCGGCQICSTTGQCRIDPTSRWKIMAISAELDNSSWDRFSGEIGGTAPDPFCEYENPAGQVTSTTAGVTDTLIDTHNPVWNQEITPPGTTVAASTLMASSPTWQIWVGDDDGCTTQNCLGDVACTIRQTISEPTLRSGQLVVNNRQSCVRVTIGFVCQPLFPVSASEE